MAALRRGLGACKVDQDRPQTPVVERLALAIFRNHETRQTASGKIRLRAAGELRRRSSRKGSTRPLLDDRHEGAKSMHGRRHWNEIRDS
jgi:hypothetical protein